MGANGFEDDGTRRAAIDDEQIRAEMAFPKAFPWAVQEVFVILRGKKVVLQQAVDKVIPILKIEAAGTRAKSLGIKLFVCDVLAHQGGENVPGPVRNSF
jgi:hypothetical protein